MRLNIPAEITPENILSLLSYEFPVMDFDEAREHDMAGREAKQTKEIEEALWQKIIAARAYHLIIAARAYPLTRDIFARVDEPACYDYAASAAHNLAIMDPGFHYIDFKCSNKALKGYQGVISSDFFGSLDSQTQKFCQRGLNYMKSNVEKRKRKEESRRRNRETSVEFGPDILPSNHRWFVSDNYVQAQNKSLRTA